MRLARFVIGILVIVAIGGYVFYTMNARNRSLSPTNATNQIEVIASFYPLYYFANEIGGEKTRVTNLTPAGTEPHDYEPNTQDIIRIQQAKMLIVNGVGLEPWFTKLSADFKKNGVKVVTVTEGLAIAQTEKDDISVKDPHVWLDPVLAVQEVEQITQAFINVDPANKSLYEANGTKLIERLQALDQSFRQGLRACKQQNIVTSHAAFGYIATRYGFKEMAIAGLNPDEEPSPQTLVNVTKLAKENNIKYIFFETLISPRLAETIAKEVGAQTLVLNPLEGLANKEQEQGKNYFSIQKENLRNLQLALECQ